MNKGKIIININSAIVKADAKASLGLSNLIYYDQSNINLHWVSISKH